MIRSFKKIHRSLRKLGLNESGAATVELVIVFPFFVGIFLSAFEVAMMNTRAVMLERATDIVVREIRLSSGGDLEYDDVRDAICYNAGVIKNCTEVLKMELLPADAISLANLTPDADCIRREEPIQPKVKFENGAVNQLMLIRVCALADPLVPGLGIGVGSSIPLTDSGEYKIIASSAFVNEPQ